MSLETCFDVNFQSSKLLRLQSGFWACPHLSRKSQRILTSHLSQAHPVAVPQSENLMAKIKAAWSIFFPPKPESVSAKEAGKSRLRMVLVADR